MGRSGVLSERVSQLPSSQSISRSLKRSKKRLIKYTLISTNIGLALLVALFVLNNPHTSQAIKQAALLDTNASDVSANPLDELSSADIAVNVARLARLPEAQAVANHADSFNAQLSIVPADSQVVAKPQVISKALPSYKDIKKYVSKDGDTIASVAEANGVTSDSVKWSNNLSGTTIPVGTTLYIPPQNGIVYDVRAGDTIDKLAEKYRANKETFILMNDAEQGLPVGRKIIIPDGVVPVTIARSVPSFAGFAWGGTTAVYGVNGYDYGYCTWWAAKRRADVGKPIPGNLGNASTWKVLAQRAGLGVGTTPAQYAVIWTPPHDYYGHVGFVESVDADGTVHVSEMNVAGWGRVSSRVLTPAQAAGYWYIY